MSPTAAAAAMPRPACANEEHVAALVTDDERTIRNLARLSPHRAWQAMLDVLAKATARRTKNAGGEE